MKSDIYADIGRRIRKKRLEAGMTQSSLCADKITRNMLSRIETGDACPSLDTLLYLASRLKVSAAYFFCRDEAEEAQYDKLGYCAELRRFISNERYDRVIAMDGGSDDEVMFAKAISEAHCALSELERFNFSSAVKHIDASYSMLKDTVYLQNSIASELKLMKHLCKALSYCESPSPEWVAASSSVVIGTERHTYLLALSLYDHMGDGLYLRKLLPEGSAYRHYLEAKQLIDEKHPDKALPLLDRCLSDSGAGATVIIPAMKDAEHCYYETGRYKEAYETSKHREALLNK